jgi:hypothetical protein
MGAGLAMDQAFAYETTEVVAGSGDRVGRGAGSQEIGHVAAQVLVPEAVDEVGEEAEGEHQRHHSRIAEAKSRGLLTVVGDGGLHHALDAAGGQPAKSFTAARNRVVI